MSARNVVHRTQHARLAKCVIWAVNFLHARGGGMVYRSSPQEGEPQCEHWLAYFRRVLKDSGVEWDDELLAYGRASNTERKRMLRESKTLKKKLEARK